MPSPDSDLIKRSKRKKEFYGEIYAKYFLRVRSYIARRLQTNIDLAEDLAQETFVRAFRGLKRFEVRGYSYLSYLLRIAHNLLVNQYRKSKDLPLSDTHKEIPYHENTEEKVNSKLNEKLMHKKLLAFPRYAREIFALRYHKELPIGHISKKVNKTENAIKILLSRMKKYLMSIVPFLQKPFAGRSVNKDRAPLQKSSSQTQKVGE